MKPHVNDNPRRNPLFYFGFLGFLGIIGIFLMTPILMSFLLCFTFFAYGSMIPDELFWDHVRRAGLYAFLSGTGFGVLCQALFIPYAIASQFRPPEFVSGMAQISEAHYLHILLVSATFVLTFILMLAVFTGSLLVYRHREKKALRESEG